MIKTFDEMWEEIECNFDWDRVARAMKSLDWVWYFEEDSRVPNVGEIINSARKSCKRAYDEKRTIATGGFFVYFENDWMKLSFELDSWDIDLTKE